jgi:hypothetical protein
MLPMLPAGLTNEQRLAEYVGKAETAKDKLDALKDTLTYEQRGWLIDLLNAASRRSYRQGYIDGMTSFAWWQNGEEMVGTCGTTLKTAVVNVHKSVFFRPDHVNWLTNE